MKNQKKTATPVTCAEVVDRLVTATNSGQKAYASKLQRTYVQSRVKMGMKEGQVIAAIKAAVTKRRMLQAS